MRLFIEVITSLLRPVKRRLGLQRKLLLIWHRQNPESWLDQNLRTGVLRMPDAPRYKAIEAIAAKINASGPQPLWKGYREVYESDNTVPLSQLPLERMPDQVRTQPEMGRLFSWLAERRRPDLIVEIGTAFGVSARYWAEGLKAASAGRLLTFDPNEIWHGIASSHLKDYDGIVEAKLGTFEDSIDECMKPGEKIDIAFVDAIHTSEFVSRQVEMLVKRLASDGFILLDDISFSHDMTRCWERWARDPRVLASVAVANRVGILEFRPAT